MTVKGTVRVVSSDPSCKGGNVRFTTVPSITMSDQEWFRCPMSMFICGFSAKVTCAFVVLRNNGQTHSKQTILVSEKNDIFDQIKVSKIPL